MLRAPIHTRTVVASAVLAAGVTGTVVDPNGPVGITAFGVAVAAGLYLVVNPFRKAVRRLAAVSRPKPDVSRSVAKVVRGRSVAAVVAGMAALFTVWLTTDLPRPLMYATWWGFCVLAAWLTAVTVITARRSVRPTP